jgi:GTP cyclohydrolase II
VKPRSAANREIDAALAELRRGRPIWLYHDRLSVAFLSIEFAGPEAVEVFAGGKPLRLLVSKERARVLGLSDHLDAEDTVVMELQGVSLEQARLMANPLLDHFAPARPSLVRAPTDAAIASCAMRLAKRAELLPALLYRYAIPGEGPGLDVDRVARYSPPDDLQLLATAPLPLDVDDSSRIFVFREDVGGLHHLALQLGRLETGGIPLVRLHSECLTGDAFFSQKCDCGAQLDDAKQLIAGDGGFLIYLREEGRKIGLVNKIRAYALQNRGLDTLDANLHIGFGADERDYLIAAEMLRQLGVSQVRLLTNNPSKAEALEAAGIAVSERLPLRTGRGPHNEAYLDTKRDRSGHSL